MSKNNAFPRTAAKWLKTFAVAALATSPIGLAQAATDKPLKLGYARVELADGTVTAAAEIATGDELTLCFADGSRKAVAK